MMVPEAEQAEHEQYASEILNWAGQTQGGSEILLLARLVAAVESLDRRVAYLTSKLK
jgi:hypothetical protein